MPNSTARVLLIEDDEDDYFLTKELFADLPPGAYHLDRVANFDDAIQAFEDCDHDLYLVDYRLGKHTGLEVIIAAMALGCRAPMIMLTGQREREFDLLAMQAGAADYLLKEQLTLAALERSMRYALQQQRLQDAIHEANQQLERRVEERTAELEKVNDSLQVEIARRQRIEDQLREVDRRKDQFLATLAHELRNPLSPLTAATQLLGLEPENATQVRELTLVMSRQLTQLVRLIDDLLDISRISGGKLQLRKSRFALGEPIAAAIELSQPLIDEGQHALRVSLPSQLVMLDGDPVRLSQAISNLLINAAKYTPCGGSIELEITVQDEQLVIRVRDTGLGIPLDKQAEIFEMFTQVDSSYARQKGGLGIGLTLVKTIVELHGGKIDVFSRGVGAGSEFTIYLPLANATSTTDDPAHAVASEVGKRPTLRILVVDDNESAAHLLSRLLDKLGQTVEVADSAPAALSKLLDFRPQLVISDVGMPGMTGLELAQAIRQLPDLEQPKMVALTGFGQASDRRDALASGFDDHLTKPIGMAELEKLIATFGT